jgi:hypothetical protein
MRFLTNRAAQILKKNFFSSVMSKEFDFICDNNLDTKRLPQNKHQKREKYRHCGNVIHSAFVYIVGKSFMQLRLTTIG